MDESVGYGAPSTENETENVGLSDGREEFENATPSNDNGENTAEMTEVDPVYAVDHPDANEEVGSPVDYEQIMREDLEVLRANFPELGELRDISELSGAMRYAALRDLGLNAIEAYLATSHRITKKDNRSHLSTAISHTAGAPRGSMSRGELAVARELFSGLSDAQLYSLYKRVTN